MGWSKGDTLECYSFTLPYWGKENNECTKFQSIIKFVILGRSLPSLALDLLSCGRGRKCSPLRAIGGEAVEYNRSGFVSCVVPRRDEISFYVGGHISGGLDQGGDTERAYFADNCQDPSPEVKLIFLLGHLPGEEEVGNGSQGHGDGRDEEAEPPGPHPSGVLRGQVDATWKRRPW